MPALTKSTLLQLGGQYSSVLADDLLYGESWTADVIWTDLVGRTVSNTSGTTVSFAGGDNSVFIQGKSVSFTNDTNTYVIVSIQSNSITLNAAPSPKNGDQIYQSVVLDPATTFTFRMSEYVSTGVIDSVKEGLDLGTLTQKQAFMFSGFGSISGTTLTIIATQFGALSIGSVITGTGISAGTTITAVGPNTNGGIGTYTINNSQTVNNVFVLSTSNKLVQLNLDSAVIPIDLSSGWVRIYIPPNTFTDIPTAADAPLFNMPTIYAGNFMINRPQISSTIKASFSKQRIVLLIWSDLAA